MVKDLLLVLKKKRKKLQSSQEESDRLRRWENKKWIIYKETEKSDKDGWKIVVLVIYTKIKRKENLKKLTSFD